VPKRRKDYIIACGCEKWFRKKILNRDRASNPAGRGSHGMFLYAVGSFPEKVHGTEGVPWLPLGM
jgi:hypothetical protein